MIDPLVEDVKRAFTTFIAEAMASAERRAIEAIQSAFRDMSRSIAAPVPSPAPATMAAHDPHSPCAPRPEARPRSRVGAAVQARVRSHIRLHPGSDTKQIAELLNVKTYQLRRPLRAMVQRGEILFDVATVGGSRRRTYYVVESSSSEAAPQELPVGAAA